MGTDLNPAENPPLLSGWMVLNATASPFRKTGYSLSGPCTKILAARAG